MAHATLLSVDPGKHDAGVAFFIDGHLAEMAFIAPPGGGPYEVARYVAAWARRCMMNVGDPEGRIKQLIVEDQKIYRRGKADPNDMLPLAECRGAVMARVDCFSRESIAPSLWTGGIPKVVRQRHFIAACTASDRAMLMAIKPATKRHNVIDAAHMGFWYLGRTHTAPEGGYIE